MMNLEKWKTMSNEEKDQWASNDKNSNQASELQIAEMMEITDKMLIEIHQNVSETLGTTKADKWANILKDLRQSEVDRRTKLRN